MMVRSIVHLLFLVVMSICLTSVSGQAKTIDRVDLQRIFSDLGVEATFVLFSPHKDRTILVNSKRATKRFIPASTFKIANSIIALETGVVENENEIVPYGGKAQPIKAWERDMSIKDAIRISNVPVYQELARRVGRDRYQQWLKRLDYGNMAVGSDVETFWLKGPLKITALEQAQWLSRLARKALPASDRSQSIVIDILELEENAGKKLYGKTGWSNAPTPDIGWFVGWVQRGGAVHTYALNMDIKGRADARLRKPLAMRLLRELGVW